MPRTILVLLLTFLLSIEVATGQSFDYCLPDIEASQGNELAYKNRGDRCEGLFIRKISGVGIRIIGFHKHPAKFENSDSFMEISVDASELANLVLTSTRKNLHYRMDTRTDKRKFILPLSVIHHPKISLRPYELAATACLDDCDERTPKLAAVSFGQNSSDNPYVLFVSDVDLDHIQVKVTDPETNELLFDRDMLRSRPSWPAGRVAEFGLGEQFASRSTIFLEILVRGRGNTDLGSVTAILSL